MSAFLIILFIVAFVIGQGNNTIDTDDETTMFLSDDDNTEETKTVSALNHIEDNNSIHIYSALEMPRELKDKTKQIL